MTEIPREEEHETPIEAFGEKEPTGEEVNVCPPQPVDTNTDGDLGPPQQTTQKRRWLRVVRRSLTPILSMAFVFLLGFVSAKLLAPAHAPSAQSSVKESQKKTLWTCSMHPQIKLPEQGKCPICFMALIPLSDGAGGQEAVLKMSKAAVKLAEIQTTKVTRRIAEAELRFVGKVDYDETRIKTITAWMPGRLDRLYVDYTGVAVKKGDHLIYLYSPDLISAQEEFIQALRAVEELRGSSSKLIKGTADDTVKAAREKLRLLGVTAGQLTELEKSRKVKDHLTIYAPTGGIVVHKNAIEGMYVKTGSPIYKIADLSFVWVYLEAYESDLTWLRYGQTVEFETEAYPGEPFKGRISFINPVLNTRTRTVKVRVNVPNREGRLKPGMFVRAKVKARMAAGGKILENTLAGKWISPMHPEVIKDKPGDCDVCGMPLVRAESLGLADSNTKADPPLLIPSSAVLLTGKRAVVYVKKQGAKSPTFEGRVLVLGPRAGDSFLVKSGLEEGDEVVSNGAFKIDSALQIQARPSMMSESESTGPVEEHNHAQGKKLEALPLGPPLRGQLRRELGPVLEAYILTQQALSADQGAEIGGHSKKLQETVEALASRGDAPKAWATLVADLTSSVKKLAQSAGLKDQRAAFSSLTQCLIVAVKSVDSPMKIDQVTCPMAFGGLGGTWLQKPGEVSNPYFGKSMLRCGDVVQSFGHPARDKPSARGLEKDSKVALKEFLRSYLAIQESLAADDKAGATEATERLGLWKEKHKETFESLGSSIRALIKAEKIEAQRQAFGVLSQKLAPLLKRSHVQPLTQVRCPMAFDGKGGDWFQRPGEIANPYFGKSMLRCGDVVAELKGAGND